MRRAPVSTSTHDRVGATTVLGWLEQPDAVTVMDVRSPAEFETAHIAGSYNVPLDLLGEHAAQLAARLDREVVLVCQSGARPRRPASASPASGPSTCTSSTAVSAPTPPPVATSCAAAPAGRWSAKYASSPGLVVAGVAASWRVPAASLLAGGVSAGLALSALTDTCTMARVLSALPHNRGPRQRTAAEILDQLPAAPTTT